MKRVQMLVLLIVCLTSAFAIPLSILEDQACQRARLEVALKSLPSICQSEGVPCQEKRAQISKDLRDYSNGIQADIDFCKRYAKEGSASDQKNTAEALHEYEAALFWAQMQSNSIAQADFNYGQTIELTGKIITQKHTEWLGMLGNTKLGRERSKWTGYILKLDAPISTKSGPEERFPFEPESDVREVYLRFSDRDVATPSNRTLGQRVRVTGKVFHRATVHEQRPVCVDVAKVTRS